LRRLPIVCALFGIVAVLGAPTQAAEAQEADAQQADRAAFVDVVQVAGHLDPVVVDFLQRSITEAEATGAEALVIQLDSPGSLVPTADLDALTFAMAHAGVPVAVWVGDAGAQALGGAARLVTEAPVAGMAPGARVGHLDRVEAPICLDGRGCPEAPAAVRTGTVGPDEALELGIVDLNAEESAILGSFIAALDGREVAGRELATATFADQEDGPPVATLDVQARLSKLPLVSQLMHTVASPPVAYLLLTIGLALLVFELFTAGVGIAGLVGAGSLLLAAYGLTVLPTSLLGLGLLLLGTFGFAIDVQTGAPRVWTGIGVVAYAVGSVLLFEDGIRLGWLPLVAGVVAMVLMMLAGLPATIRSRFSTPTIGRTWMVGELGEAMADVRPEGVVRVREALWPAFANRSTPITAGDRVRVIGIEGTRLEVEPEAGGARDHHERRSSA
jgi:membrane-bound serine protease (ClpP class)